MPPGPATGWKVESQEAQLGQDAQGRVAQGMLVRFVTGKGVRSQLFFPAAMYNRDNVRAAIQAAAAEIDHIHGLTG